MIFGVFSLYFYDTNVKKLTCKRMKFKNQLKIEFLSQYTRNLKVLENIPPGSDFMALLQRAKIVAYSELQVTVCLFFKDLPSLNLESCCTKACQYLH